MLNSKSVINRFLVSVFSNVIRAAIGFFSGLLIARGLHPTGYGDFTFLLGSFAAIRSLLDMGSSSAFYTFIAQKKRSRKFFLLYFGWLALQFAITGVAVFLIMPQAMLAKVWVGHGREIILLAFAASFMQQQVWQTVNQIGESTRQTVRVQALGMLVATVHLALIAFFLYKYILSVRVLFVILIVEYVVAVLVAYLFLQNRKENGHKVADVTTAAQIIAEFWHYCKPLIILSWIGFTSEFADRWMLQRFGGAGQQGFYQIAYQFSAVSLLATASILNIFWKEIAEAHGRGDSEKVALLYLKVNRGLVMFGATLSGFLIPWTDEIVRILLGASYALAAPVLVLMFLYPIHQSMGQIGGTMLLASGRTKVYMAISSLVMLVSLPVSYLIQAPPTAPVIAGLGLGAKGMALKMVFLNILSVNVQAWVIARFNRWRFDWFFQVAGIASVVGIGFLVKLAVNFYWDLSQINYMALFPPFIAALLLYGVAIFCLIWAMPWLAGFESGELKSLLIKFKDVIGTT